MSSQCSGPQLINKEISKASNIFVPRTGSKEITKVNSRANTANHPYTNGIMSRSWKKSNLNVQDNLVCIGSSSRVINHSQGGYNHNLDNKEKHDKFINLRDDYWKSQEFVSSISQLLGKDISQQNKASRYNFY